MTQTKIKNVKHTFNASILLQIALEQLECVITGETPFVRENKKRLNNTISWLNSENEAFTNSMNKNELQLFSDVTDKLRGIINEFNLELE
jgi:hypothetical protein